MSDSLFTDKQETTTQEVPVTPSASTPDTFADQLSRIKNERGEPKYDSPAKAFEALVHSQEYIPQLKGQVAQYETRIKHLEEELNKRETVEDVIARLTPRQEAPVVPTSQPNVIDEASVEAMLQKALAKRDTDIKVQGNQKLVQDALIAKFGDKAREVIAAKAAELDITPSQLGTLSASSPKAVLKLFEAHSSAPTGAPLRSSVTIPDKPESELKVPAKSLLRGASGREQEAFIKSLREKVLKENNL